MWFGESVFRLLKEQLLPEVTQVKVDVAGLKGDVAGLKVEVQGLKVEVQGVKSSLDLLVTRLETMERESQRRFELVDKRFDEQAAESARRYELIDRQIELVDKRLERLEAAGPIITDRLQGLTEAVGKLSILGDYVRRVDEIGLEVRELRRRFDEADRRYATEVLPRLPKTGS